MLRPARYYRQSPKGDLVEGGKARQASPSAPVSIARVSFENETGVSARTLPSMLKGGLQECQGLALGWFKSPHVTIVRVIAVVVEVVVVVVVVVVIVVVVVVVVVKVK